MMTRQILTLGLCAVLLGGGIEAGALRGRVLDAETGGLVQDANIKIVETGKTVASDRHGTFDFRQLPDSSYHLVVTHVAYNHSDTVSVDLHGDRSIDIRLKAAPWVLNDVVVTGTRSPHLLKDVPVQTEVVGQQDFEKVGAKSVDEALSSAIGIKINKDFVSQSAAIRGTQGNQVLIMVDGQRQVGRVNGSIDLSQYSLANVEKIEVVKGTGSTLYGSDAMGGVINIISKKPKLDERYANLYVDYGTFRSLNPSLDFNLGGAKTGLLFGAKFYRTDGYDLNPATLNTEGGDKINRGNFDARLTHQLSQNLKFTVDGRYMKERRNWFEDALVGPILFLYSDKETNQRYDGSAGLEYLSGKKYSMKFRVAGTSYNHDFQKWDTSFTNWVDTSQTTDRSWEVNYSSNYVIGQNHIITYGGDYNYAGLKSKELFQDNKSEQSADAYLSYEHNPIKGLTILPGVRYENHQTFGQKVNPSFNLMVQPSEGIRLRGSVAEGFRAPSLKEEYYIFDHSSAGYIVYGGYVPIPDSILAGLRKQPLKPENSINSSISAEISYGSIGMHRITYFYNHLENLIQFTRIGWTSKYYFGMYVYQNVQRAITQGIEWESRVKMSPGADLAFSYDYLYTRDLTTHMKLRDCPDHTVKLSLTGHSRKLGVDATFWGTYESPKRFVARNNTGGNIDDTTEVYAPHRTTLNLNVSKSLGGGELFVRMENLLNETNVEYGYGPGFQVYAGVKYSLDLRSLIKHEAH
jgi:outer membrane receptor for ferrienterochelin and colicins